MIKFKSKFQKLFKNSRKILKNKKFKNKNLKW